MNFKILTLFPELFPGPLSHSIIGAALKKKIYVTRAYMFMTMMMTMLLFWNV